MKKTTTTRTEALLSKDFIAGVVPLDLRRSDSRRACIAASVNSERCPLNRTGGTPVSGRRRKNGLRGRRACTVGSVIKKEEHI